MHWFIHKDSSPSRDSVLLVTDVSGAYLRSFAGNEIQSEGIGHLRDALLHPNGPKGITMLDLAGTGDQLGIIISEPDVAALENKLKAHGTQVVCDLLTSPDGLKEMTSLDLRGDQDQ